MNDEIRKNLFDIVHAAEEIANFVQGMNFAAYKNSAVTQRAVERNFEIIGEALNRVRNIDDQFVEKISEHHRIIAFRNILIHGYDIVDEAIVWKAATAHLPTLVTQVKEILQLT